MVSHVLKIDPTYPKQVRDEEEDRRVLVQASPFSHRRENPAYFKNSDLSLSLKRESHSVNSPSLPFLAQARRFSLRRESSNIAQDFTLPERHYLNLTRLLANDAQNKVFEENFHGRAIFTPKYANDIYPELVRVFYCNMNFKKNLMTSHVKGKDIVLDMKTFSSICCDIPMIGDKTGFRPEEIERRKQQRLGETVKNRDILSVGYLTLEDHGETKVALNLRESKVDIEVVHKMGFVIDLVTRRTFKYRTERQPTPTDEP
ncbi:hypothetical protein Lal_00018478 [Lupinus albus]|nr:hypothetical protein Lal_00018478 [Lupinus albus]